MGIFTTLALFLKPLHYFVKLNSLFLHIRNIFCFSHWDGWLIWNLVFVFPPIYISVNFVKVNMNGIYFRDILLIRISRGANNCVQRVFENFFYFIMIFPPILNSYYPMKGSIFVNFLNKRSKRFIQINFHSLLWSYLPRVPIFLAMTVYSYQCNCFQKWYNWHIKIISEGSCHWRLK